MSLCCLDSNIVTIRNCRFRSFLPFTKVSHVGGGDKTNYKNN